MSPSPVSSSDPSSNECSFSEPKQLAPLPARVPRCRDSKSRQGAVTVEFAICASVFFMVIFTLLEFSRFMFVKHSVQMVAYEAARVGVVPGATAAHVSSRAQALLTASGIRQADVVITPPVINSHTEEVTVSVSCDFSQNSWLPPTYLTGQMLTSTISLEHENQAYLTPEGTDVIEIIGDNNNEPIDE